jgi:hypothetical protein
LPYTVRMGAPPSLNLEENWNCNRWEIYRQRRNYGVLGKNESKC